MREIEFRAWDTAKNQWSIASVFLDTLEPNPRLQGIDRGLILNTINKDIILEQYTGLKDNNGVKIFEGDIVQGRYGIPPVRVRSQVIYDGSSFIINTKGHKPESVTLQTGMECLVLTVIGNIHENPELLGD